MKKGCAISSGCGGLVILLVVAFIIINFISNLKFSFDGFNETSSDYTFEVDTVGNQPVIVADYKWKFTSTSLGRRNYNLTFKLLELEVKKALAYLDNVAKLSASELNVSSKYKSDKITYAKLTWHEIYKRVYWQAYDKFDMILKGFDEVFSNNVVTRTSYVSDEIVWGAKFRMMYHPNDDKSKTVLDIDKLNVFDHVPLPEPAIAATS